MCRFIVRRDPTRPAFWYMSFRHPHPPLVPLAAYLDLYRDTEIDEPFVGEWARDPLSWPYALRERRKGAGMDSEVRARMARRAFYAQCTHIDHQIRTVIGTLREEGLVDDTIVMLTADHGDMLGNHSLWAKGLFYEEAAKIPMLLVPTADQVREMGHGIVDDRLANQADVMPTLLELCDIPAPETVEGLSLVGSRRRDHIVGYMWEGARATRMVRDDRHKLVYYPAGNRLQLFDMETDPDEMRDVAEDAEYAAVREGLTRLLVENLHGSDLDWLDADRLVGMPEPEELPPPDRGLSNQRGYRFR